MTEDVLMSDEVSSRPSVSRFGRSALRTPANLVTGVRIVAGIPILVLIHSKGASWTTVSLWFVLTMSDLIDGWLARREGTTRSGAFLDPVADKLIVLGGLWALADRGEVAYLVLWIIAGREGFVSGMRVLFSRRGVTLPARRWGKYKTFVQNSAIGLVLLPFTENVTELHEVVFAVAVVLTVISGADLIVHARRSSPEVEGSGGHEG